MATNRPPPRAASAHGASTYPVPPQLRHGCRHVRPMPSGRGGRWARPLVRSDSDLSPGVVRESDAVVHRLPARRRPAVLAYGDRAQALERLADRAATRASPKCEQRADLACVRSWSKRRCRTCACLARTSVSEGVARVLSTFFAPLGARGGAEPDELGELMEVLAFAHPLVERRGGCARRSPRARPAVLDEEDVEVRPRSRDRRRQSKLERASSSAGLGHPSGRAPGASAGRGSTSRGPAGDGSARRASSALRRRRTPSPAPGRSARSP